VDNLGNVTRIADLTAGQSLSSFSLAASSGTTPPLTSTRSLIITPGREFSASSFLFQPLADNAPLDPNSTGYVNNLVSQISRYYGVADVNINQYTPAIFIVGPNQPTVRV